MRPLALLLACLGATATPLVTPGCSTAPKSQSDRDELVARASSTRRWFESQVVGLRTQIDYSAGCIVFPDVAQWGIIFGGGSYGRGVVFDATGKQIGWASINTGSIGLQAGVQGFRLLIVMESKSALAAFKEGTWQGRANAVAVAGDSGGSGTAPFQNGVAVYEGASTGLMAGVNIGLEHVAYQPIERPLGS